MNPHLVKSKQCFLFTFTVTKAPTYGSKLICTSRHIALHLKIKTRWQMSLLSWEQKLNLTLSELN